MPEPVLVEEPDIEPDKDQPHETKPDKPLKNVKLLLMLAVGIILALVIAKHFV